MKRKNGNLKAGILLSYVLLAFNTLYGLFITPFILSSVGEISYGVYKSVSSLSATIAIMDLGLGSTTTRYMAKFNATNDKKEAGNFLAMMFLQFLFVAMLVFGVGAVIYFLIPDIYQNTFTSADIALAKELVLFLIINMVLRMFEHLIMGVANGYEKFIFANLLKLFSMISKVVIILIILPITKNITLVVVSETIILCAAIIVLFIYILLKVKVVPRLCRWDNAVFKESFVYTALMFVQTITVQFNGNVDNILIGAQIGATSVTVYSMALMLYNMYQNLSGSIANVMLPNISKKVASNASSEQLQGTVERAGRMQFWLLGAALGGFIVLGKDFYNLWLGDSFADCYYLTLILIIPVTVTMSQNVSLSVLRAKNKMGYRTLTLGISCIINIVVSIIGIHFFGYWGAAIGTAVSAVANLIFMNLYYKHKLGFRIFKMLTAIMLRTSFCIVVASLVTFFSRLIINGTWFSFALNVLIFCMVYFPMLLFVSLLPHERRKIFAKFRRT